MNRLNKLYTHPLLGDLLDNGNIEFAILDALEAFKKIKSNAVSIETYYSIQVFMKFKII